MIINIERERRRDERFRRRLRQVMLKRERTPLAEKVMANELRRQRLKRKEQK